MTSFIRCLQCGATLTEPVGPCIHCGGAIEVAVTLTGNESKASQGQLGTVADIATPQDARQINYTAPTGARSHTTLVGDQIAVHIEPPVDVGSRGESRVCSCVVACLAAGGAAPILLPASDEAGEDRVLLISGVRVTLQIVTARPDTSFWGEVAKGASEVHAPISEAATWINNAICAKANHYPSRFKASMLLAVDVAHMGVLAAPSLREQYLQCFGDPSAVLHFGGVWLVGPTENLCVRLGRSRW